MRDKSSMFSTPMLAGVMPALVLLFSLLLAHAGEPIQFSNEKAKPAPGNPQQPDADLFKSQKAKRPASAPLNNTLTPFIRYGGSLDPKDERRLKAIREEKKNWMLLEPGELQQRDEEEENQFGGRGITMDDLDHDRENYLFPAPQKAERASRPQNAPAEDEQQPKKDNRSLSIFGPREPEKPGAHTSSELNLKNLIDPTQVDVTKFNNNEASLFQFLKDNAAPAPDRDHQARRDSFRDFINGPQPNGTPQGISDPINFRTDLTQQRMNPVLPAQSGLEMSAPKPPDAFSTRPPLGNAFTPGKAASLPDLISSTAPRQPMPGSSLPSPFLTPNDAAKASRPSVMGGSLFERQTPRRGGL